MNAVTTVTITVASWLLMIGHARYQRMPLYARRVFAIGALIIIAKGVRRIALMVVGNVVHPPDWDLQIFWINGTIAARRLNFYDPVLATQLAAPFHPSAGFSLVHLIHGTRGEALGTPFLYPPPSILWFIPLGWFDIHHAAIAWYAIQLTCLIASVFVLSLTFFRSLAVRNLAFTAALLFMVHGTYWNVSTAQTLFMLLLFISLAFRYRNSTWGGMWLALAILVKPFVAVVALYAVLLRKWKSLAGLVATLLVTTLVTFVVFGRIVFTSYAAIPFHALPMSMYTELANQSLLAWILRISHSPTRFPPLFGIVAAVLGLILLWRLGQVQKQNEAAGFAFALTVGMLLYPASLQSYTVVLVLPILILQSAGLWIPVALAYGLMYLGQGDYVILATLLIAVALALRMPQLCLEEPPLLESSPNHSLGVLGSL